MRKWTRAERKLFKTFLELHRTAAATLGERNWFLLQTYGRITYWLCGRGTLMFTYERVNNY